MLQASALMLQSAPRMVGRRDRHSRRVCDTPRSATPANPGLLTSAGLHARRRIVVGRCIMLPLSARACGSNVCWDYSALSRRRALGTRWDPSSGVDLMADNEEFVERRRPNRNLHIERRNPSALTWILGAVLLVIVLALAFSPDGAGRPGPGYVMPDAGGSVVPDSEMRAAEVDAAIGDFARFVSGQRARDVIGPKHEYTAEGIRRVAAAISALAREDTLAGGAVRPRIQALRDRANALQRDPSADTHALKAREAFLFAASILESNQVPR